CRECSLSQESERCGELRKRREFRGEPLYYGGRSRLIPARLSRGSDRRTRRLRSERAAELEGTRGPAQGRRPFGPGPLLHEEAGRLRREPRARGCERSRGT